MIDIHCHILPGIDDGSKDLNESLQMAKIAQKEGIKKIVNTSHYHPNFDYIMGEMLLDNLKKLNDKLKEEKIDIEVLIGNELYYSDNLLEDMDKKNFYSLNNSKYILVEFSPTMFPKNLCEVIYELKIRGYTPILAHIERYKEVQENPKIVKDAIEEGALIQVNASSVLGKSGRNSIKICEILLKYNKVHFIATDAHGSDRRTPLMKDAYNYIVDNYGEIRAKKLFLENPDCVINNNDIEIYEEEIQRSSKLGFFGKLFKKKI